MKEQIIYIPVPVEKEKPTEEREYSCKVIINKYEHRQLILTYYHYGGFMWAAVLGDDVKVTHWLKPVRLEELMGNVTNQLLIEATNTIQRHLGKEGDIKMITELESLRWTIIQDYIKKYE